MAAPLSAGASAGPSAAAGPVASSDVDPLREGGGGEETAVSGAEPSTEEEGEGPEELAGPSAEDLGASEEEGDWAGEVADSAGALEGAGEVEFFPEGEDDREAECELFAKAPAMATKRRARTRAWRAIMVIKDFLVLA